MKHSVSKFAVLVLAMSGFAAQAQQPDLEAQVNAASQSLKGVVVTGSSDPLLRSDQRLALINASLPLDAKNSLAQSSDFERVAGLFPESADAASGEARRMMERNHNPPVGSDPDGDISLGAR